MRLAGAAHQKIIARGASPQGFAVGANRRAQKYCSPKPKKRERHRVPPFAKNNSHTSKPSAKSAALLGVLLYDHPVIIIATIATYSVRCLVIPALGAFHQGGSLKLPHIGTPLILSCAGYLSLGYCHEVHLLILLGPG